MNDEHTEYAALTQHAGWLALPAWTQLEMTGNDRVTFLNGMCTNDIRNLTAGKGCEAFATTSDGKILAHILVFASEQRFEIITVPGQAEILIKHWDRYIIREDVRIRDISAEQSLLLVAGPDSPAALAKLLNSEMPSEPLDHIALLSDAAAIHVRRMEAEPPVFWITAAASDVPRFSQKLNEVGVELSSEEAWEMLRVELGWPMFGRDITVKNLPQEINRDRQAISLVKGCYIGQETVARIDALGHVNWKLMGLRLPALASWNAGTEIQFENKVVARITSTAFSPKLKSPIALAFVRRGFDQPGRRLTGAGGEAEVLSLPLWGTRD